jgi:tryptophan synthase alpha chain
VLEVGVPFSDPTADGPTIQRASERALAAGTTLAAVLDAIAALRARRPDVPIVLFGYYNPILRFGEARLAAAAKEAGVDGVLVVDLPPESAAPLLEPLREAGLAFVPLIAPTSGEARLAGAAAVADAFVYAVSRTGVTGGGELDLAAAGARARHFRETHGRPVAVGFGVRTAEDVATLSADADGVVVGSAVVKALAAAAPEERVEAVRSTVAALAAGLAR